MPRCCSPRRDPSPDSPRGPEGPAVPPGPEPVAPEPEAALAEVAASSPEDPEQPEAPPGEQLAQTLDAYVAFVERRREPYLALFRGAAGGADYVVEIYERTRAVFVDRARRALGGPRDPRTDLALHGWFGFVEDAVLAWTGGPTIPRDDLLRLLHDSLAVLTAPQS